MLLIPVGENVPVILLNFTSKGLDISNDPDLLKCFLNQSLPNVEENNPVYLNWIHTQQNTDTELDTKDAKHPKIYFSWNCHFGHGKAN